MFFSLSSVLTLCYLKAVLFANDENNFPIFSAPEASDGRRRSSYGTLVHIHVCVCVCAGLGLLLPFHFKKPGRNIALRHFLLKAQPAAVHLILNQPQLNEGTTERVCYQYNSDQSRVLGA